MKKKTAGNKYNAHKKEYDGIAFDSKKEADRYAELKLLERAGQISNLQRQVQYLLVPNQYIDGKCVERSIKYIADFTYTQNGKVVVEDVKGYRDPSSAGYAKFVIKRKLMLYTYGIKVKEV